MMKMAILILITQMGAIAEKTKKVKIRRNQRRMMIKMDVVYSDKLWLIAAA